MISSKSINIVPMLANIPNILFTFSLNIHLKILYTKIPIHPPKVFSIISVISERPIANVYWTISNKRLTHKKTKIFFKKVQSIFNIFMYIPKGTNIIALLTISDISILWFTIVAPLNGIKLMLRTLSILSMENCSLKIIIQTSADK